ncbi:MAG: mRNA interferase RelE/StbE [Cyanobium sp.]|jgi:mRNA interferase RelE/StbE
MSYELTFHPEALREWQTLSAGIREQFKKKLAERLIEPRIPASKLRGSSHRYKIKLRATGFRLVYEVRDCEVLVLVVAVGKRERMTHGRLQAL